MGGDNYLVKKEPTAAAQDFLNDLAAAVKKSNSSLNSFEILAILANLIGKLIAIELSPATPEQLIELVFVNMNQGNLEATKSCDFNELAEGLFKVPPAGSA